MAGVLGGGQFGIVNKGYLKSAADTTRSRVVAVKQLKASEATAEEEQEFFAEMELMKDIGSHNNVVSLLAVCTSNEPYLMVIEYCARGDLLHLMRAGKKTSKRGAEYSSEDMIDFAAQVASGMGFLAKHNVRCSMSLSV